MFRKILLVFMVLAGFGAQATKLDSLHKVFEKADVHSQINMLRLLDRNGEKREDLNRLIEQVRARVKKSGLDSLKYKLMAYEGDLMVYSSRGGEGIKKLLEALRYFEKNGSALLAADVAYKIGRYYFYTKDLKQSLKYIRLADKYSPKNDLAQKATYQMVIGILYQNMQVHDSALYYQSQSIRIKEKSGNMASLPVSLNNIAELYLDLGNDLKAMEIIDRSIGISDSLHIDDALAYARHVKGKIYIKQKNFREAVLWLLPASKFWENRATYEDLQDSYTQLALAYEGMGNYERAYEYAGLLRGVTDSIFNSEKLKNASELEAKYQNEKDALVIARQKAEKDVVESEKRYQLTIFIFLAAFLVVNAFIFYWRYKKQKKDKELIAHQKIQLEVRNKDIEDSISYSSKVQQSIFPSLLDFTSSFADSFILFRPKEKVSGDFYWHERKGGLVLFAAADCTGHGVPGAMVSVVCSNALNRAVKEFGMTDPGRILDKARELVVETFEKSESEVKDGMDISFCVMDTQTNMLRWAGANNPLWLIRKNGSEVQQVDPNKQPIGKHSGAAPFTTHDIQLQPGDVFYIFTDGFADQFGGEKGKKFKAAKMKELLLGIKNEPMEKQKQALSMAFDQWRGELEQIDDVCVIGIRV